METERGEQNRLINSLNLEIQVSRTQLALRTVQEAQRKRELSDAARRAAEALNLTIPAANASGGYPAGIHCHAAAGMRERVGDDPGVPGDEREGERHRT
ncbi:hypothetical protein [Escherichia coli]|uniref:hypothetical protein n=1 Tax=Escherichia coli TaxID=562 RepID=UPI001FCEF3F9|nr:hypothetical protein [Escherichia coli]